MTVPTGHRGAAFCTAVLIVFADTRFGKCRHAAQACFDNAVRSVISAGFLNVGD